MKKFILTLVALFTLTVSASAMSYEQARQQALFLTDKMAYELNLTEDQYEAAYEINLDYLMGVNTYDDLYGAYWRQRNLDLSYILLDWQYRSFVSAYYFYRPLYWDGGFWHFGIYARYPHRDYFFFGRPHFYNVYRGGHSWRMNGGRSWYHGRDFGGPRPGGQPRMGMRDGFNRGDFGRGRSFGNMRRPNGPQEIGAPQNNRGFGKQNDRSFGQPNNRSFGQPNNRSFGQPNNRDFGNRQSSTRTTVPNDRPSRSFGNTNNRSNIFGGNRSFGGNNQSNPGKTFVPRSTPNTSSFGNSRSFGGGNRGGGNVGSPSRSNGGSQNGGGHFGGRR